MSGFVVCPNCGSRIKAGRGHCLRCFETLPVEGSTAPEAWWKSLQLSQGATLIAGVVLTLAALLLSAIIWETATPTVDDVARPASGVAPPAASGAASREAVPGVPNSSPATLLVSDPPFVDPSHAGADSLPPGNVETARTTYEGLLANQPSDPETLNNLGQALVRLGKLEEALPRFERAAALAPDKWAYRFNLAYTAGQLLQWDLAAAAYRHAAGISPTDAASQFNLAMALHKKGADAAAVPEFEKAVKLDPNDPSFRLALGMSLERVGHISEAVDAYRSFLEMDPGSSDAQKLKAHVEALSSAQPPVHP
jgi:cytochrome c-type biogenesis protein CcmH/NrfG